MITELHRLINHRDNCCFLLVFFSFHQYIVERHSGSRLLTRNLYLLSLHIGLLSVWLLLSIGCWLVFLCHLVCFRLNIGIRYRISVTVGDPPFCVSIFCCFVWYNCQRISETCCALSCFHLFLSPTGRYDDVTMLPCHFRNAHRLGSQSLKFVGCPKVAPYRLSVFTNVDLL